MYDGGSKILGYNVEARKAGHGDDDTDDDWIQMNPDIIRRCEYIVPNLSPGGEYNIRVKAVNIAGVGDATEVSGKV